MDKTCADRSYGARPLRRALQKYVEDPSEALIQGQLAGSSLVEVFLSGVELISSACRNRSCRRRPAYSLKTNGIEVVQSQKSISQSPGWTSGFGLYDFLPYNAPLCCARSWQLGSLRKNHSCCLQASSALGKLPLFFCLWIIIQP